jgi:hypothetical protein
MKTHVLLTDKIARFLCKEFYCASAFCRECAPGSRAYEAAETILGIVADFRPPVPIEPVSK